MAKTLYSNRLLPAHYCGVDANKFDIPDMLKGKKIHISIWAETDFCALDPEDVGLVVRCSMPKTGTHDEDTLKLPNVVTCFEVLEHVTPEHCRRMLLHFQKLTSQDCHYFISTPCWNGSAAENHINEMTFGALGSLIEDVGYKVEGVYGTFASITDYQGELSAVTVYDKNTGKEMSRTDLRDVFAALRNYYDTNVLSTIFAPLFPAQARNCLWHLTRRNVALPNEPMFTKLKMQPTPWSEHPNWIELSGHKHAHGTACSDPDTGEFLCLKEGIWLGKS